ncbi:hypothetical protein K461DRAFT_48626 [Myriangium duriaei CBS 260.36]|uniref:Uncharacterized protein n=1 Tax=Myriangium duriaei CBS 260.36 TaxID=1168546 RepID=A0A9P4IW42_9PEZI|nr:hypothetical protein K461DRAFT_48626 [Myriangium duriaei CBS 260.36]
MHMMQQQEPCAVGCNPQPNDECQKLPEVAAEKRNMLCMGPAVETVNILGLAKDGGIECLSCSINGSPESQSYKHRSVKNHLLGFPSPSFSALCASPCIPHGQLWGSRARNVTSGTLSNKKLPLVPWWRGLLQDADWQEWAYSWSQLNPMNPSWTDTGAHGIVVGTQRCPTVTVRTLKPP